MNGWTVAVVSYGIAVVISLFVAGLIQVMGAILTRFAKDNEAVIEPPHIDPSDEAASDAAVAAAIVIAKRTTM